MPKYTPKAARERAEKYVNSWTENSPEKRWAEMSLDELKAKRAAVEAVEDQIAASEAHTRALKIERDNLNKALMTDCDYVAKDVEGDRAFGPDSALYAGFGYIRKSERRRGGRRAATPNGEPT